MLLGFFFFIKFFFSSVKPIIKRRLISLKSSDSEQDFYLKKSKQISDDSLSTHSSSLRYHKGDNQSENYNNRRSRSGSRDYEKRKKSKHF